eukprot:1483970-Pleurochrysis_carterae.AAC.1
MDKGPSAKGRAAIASSDSIVDEQLDAAIGNVLLVADTQPRSMDVGASLRAQQRRCHVQSRTAHARGARGPGRA